MNVYLSYNQPNLLTDGTTGSHLEGYWLEAIVNTIHPLVSVYKSAILQTGFSVLVKQDFYNLSGVYP